LGYQGFSQLQQEIQEFLTVRTDPLKRLETRFLMDDNQGSTLSQIYQNQLTNMEKTFSWIDESKMRQAVEYLENAGHIFTLGTRGSYCVTTYLAHHLNRVFRQVNVLHEGDMIAEQLLGLRSGDVIIIANMPRYSRQIYSTAQIAKSMEARIITITDSEFSPFTQVSDILFFAPNRSQDYHNSMLSAMLVAEVLISLVIERNLDKARLNLDRLEPIYADLETFFPVYKNAENGGDVV
jgi:DNA-binding MurR/RpiR family transcriptional regulator